MKFLALLVRSEIAGEKNSPELFFVITQRESPYRQINNPRYYERGKWHR